MWKKKAYSIVVCPTAVHQSARENDHICPGVAFLMVFRLWEAPG